MNTLVCSSTIVSASRDIHMASLCAYTHPAVLASNLISQILAGNMHISKPCVCSVHHCNEGMGLSCSSSCPPDKCNRAALTSDMIQSEEVQLHHSNGNIVVLKTLTSCTWKSKGGGCNFSMEGYRFSLLLFQRCQRWCLTACNA